MSDPRACAPRLLQARMDFYRRNWAAKKVQRTWRAWHKGGKAGAAAAGHDADMIAEVWGGLRPPLLAFLLTWAAPCPALRVVSHLRPASCNPLPSCSPIQCPSALPHACRLSFVGDPIHVYSKVDLSGCCLAVPCAPTRPAGAGPRAADGGGAAAGG